MDDDDLDALAAEYVLGTLPSDERAHAEALIVIDPGFVEIVRQWERRLGELNVMVEAVEPPAELWDKIKDNIATVAPGDQVALSPAEGAPAEAATPDTASESKGKSEQSAMLGALAASLTLPDGEAKALPEGEAEARSKTAAEAELAGKPAAAVMPQPPAALPPSPLAPQIERSAEVFYLARRVRRWRRAAAASGALAAVLAALIVVSQVEPGLIPAGGFHVPRLFAPSGPPSPATAAVAPGSRLVAVLQQQPSSPAFLLTIDPGSRTLTVRRVSAAEQAGHSYELWLIAPHAQKPVSLGLVGGGEYTRRPLPAAVDVDTIRAAAYAVSFEPAGGSKSGAPSGPILFTGKLVESLPPPASGSPKT